MTKWKSSYTERIGMPDKVNSRDPADRNRIPMVNLTQHGLLVVRLFAQRWLRFVAHASKTSNPWTACHWRGNF